MQSPLFDQEEERAVTHAFARKLAACSLTVAFTVAASAHGFAAERPAAAPTRPTLLASGKKQVQQLATVTVRARGRAAQQEGTAGSGYDTPGSFFRTKRGVALLVLAAAGVGYMTYSAFNDRIHSDARARLDN